MDASTRSTHDLDDEDEDMDSFLKTIKLHDRFSDGYYNRDEEILSDEESSANSDDLSDWCKREQRDYRSVLKSEAKAEALSMLDTVKSSCLDDLILKNSESRSVDRDGGSFYRCPPFGDPLSEDDILQSALSLLDDEQCKKFREVGLFDGFVVEGNILKDAEKLLGDTDTNFTDQGLNLSPLPPKTPEKCNHDSQNKLISVPKSEGFKNTCILPPPPPVLPEGVLQKPETTHHSNPEKSILRENKKCCGSDTDISANDGSSIGGDSLGVDTLKSSNHGLKKKTRRKKGNAVSASPANAIAKKPKKLQIKKTDLVSDSLLQESELLGEDKKIDAANVDDIRQGIACSSSSSSVTLVQEVALSDFGFTEDEEIGEEFTIVLNKKKSRMRRDACHPADVESEAAKDKHGVRGARSSPVSTLSSASYPMPSSFRGSEAMTSKRSSCSGVNGSSCFVSAASARSERPERRTLSDSLSRPSYSSSSTRTPNSYASILGDSLPRLAVTATTEVAKLSAKDDSERHGSEVESERLLSPPQSEVDTGFSSASSVCTDETHTSGVTLAELSGSSYFSSDRADSEVYQDQGFISLKTVVEESMTSDNKPHPPTSVIPQTLIEYHKVESLEHGNGVACSNRLPDAKHRKSAIFFDTREPRVPDSMTPIDIAFGFDSGDECSSFKTCAGAMDATVLLKNMTDLKDVTFFAGSSDGTTSADDGNGCLDIILVPRTSFTAAEDGESDIKSSKPESLEISVDDKSDASVNSDRRRKEHSEEVCVYHRKNLQIDACVDISCLRSGNDDVAGTVKISSPRSKFDLRAAQKFLGIAFANAVRQESGPTSLHF